MVQTTAVPPNTDDQSLRTFLQSIQGIPSDVLRNASKRINRTMDTQKDDPEIYDLLDSMRHHDLGSNIILSLVFSVIVLVSLFGNSLVVYVIMRNKRMHTVTNVFITNLAVADLLITFLNIPFNLVRYIMTEWVFGNVMCHVINFVQTISVYSFTFTLCSIAFDRYMVIMHPLRPRISMKFAFGVVTMIWVLSSVLSVPFALWYGEMIVTNNLVLNSVRCTKTFPNKDVERYVYLCTAMSQYIIPLIIISIVYGRIAQHLWVRVTLGHVTRDQKNSHMRSKRKSIKMLVCVVLAFAICWLPLNCYYLILHFPPPDHSIKHSGKVVFSCYWVAMTSVGLNPFIYSWFNSAFRVEVVNRFSCCFTQKRQIHPGWEIDGLLVRSDQVRRSMRGSVRTVNSSNSLPNHAAASRRLNQTSDPVGVVYPDRLTEYSPLSDQVPMTERHQVRSDSVSDSLHNRPRYEIQEHTF